MMLKRHTCPHCQARFARPEYPNAKPLDLLRRTPRACPSCGGAIQLKWFGWNTAVVLCGLFFCLTWMGLLGEERWLRNGAAIALLLLALLVPLRYVDAETRPKREAKQEGIRSGGG